MRKILVGKNMGDERTELYVFSDSEYARAVYKSIARNGYKWGIYSTFLNKPIFREGRVYGIVVDYHGDYTADFSVVGERTIAGWYADGLI